MSNVQKIIKYLAIAFAMFLTFTITSGIASSLFAISNIFDNKDHYELLEELKDLKIEDAAKVLDIDITSSNMIIKVGDSLKATTSNKYIECNQDKDSITITEKKHNWIHNSNKSTLVIYVPKDMTFDGVSINSGTGKIEIEKLSTKILNLDLGAGKVDINNLNVLNNTKIDGKAGELVINSSNLNNLDLNMGIGKFKFTGKLSGKSEIDHGLGALSLNLLGNKEDYQIHLDKGLGSATLDNNNIKDDETIGNGINKIDIDGGIGSIDIDFIDKN